jgi:hypothetical protein
MELDPGRAIVEMDKVEPIPPLGLGDLIHAQIVE